MRDTLLLFLTDEEIILYKGLSKTIYPLQENTDLIQSKLTELLSDTPEVPLRLLIDRHHQDVREEQLPPLFLWDRLRLLLHKRDGWVLQGGFYGHQFLKQDGKLYLQWVNISQNDSLIHWISWVKSLPNPFSGLYFVSLEAGNFLKKHFSPSHDYLMLIYQISPHKTRYMIFTGRRLLLSRPLSGEEDLRASLHFLSRTYPDIHEKLQIFSCIRDLSLILPHVITVSDPHALINFLAFQKKPSLSLNINLPFHRRWIRRSAAPLLISSLVLIGIIIYQGHLYKRETQALLSKIAILKIKILDRKTLLENQNATQARSALDHYYHIQSQIRDPLKILEKLSSVLNKHGIRLENLVWTHTHIRDLKISFFMQNHKVVTLSEQFNALLSSLARAFPHSHVQVIEAPFKSSAHETYSYPTNLSLPMAQIKITQP